MGTIGNIKRDIKKAITEKKPNAVSALAKELEDRWNKKDSYINKQKK